MTDPPRLSDDETPGARLLRAGRDDVPSFADLERTLAAVAAAGSIVAGTSSATGAVSAGNVAWTIPKWLGAGLIGGAVTMSGAELLRSHVSAEPAARTSIERAANPALPARPAPERAETPPPPAPAEGSLEAEIAPAGEVTRAEPPHDRAEPPVPERTLGVVPVKPSQPDERGVAFEMRLVDEARRALAEGRGADALRSLSRYRAESTSRALAPEASYLEMESAVLLGDQAAARRAAVVLVTTYPDGPHAARARQVLGDPSSGRRR